MRLLKRKSPWERLLEPAGDSVAKLPKTVQSGLADVSPSKAVKSGLTVVGSVVGLTAASAVVSSVRRRQPKGSRNHS
jgi:hypothetical protein